MGVGVGAPVRLCRSAGCGVALRSGLPRCGSAFACGSCRVCAFGNSVALRSAICICSASLIVNICGTSLGARHLVSTPKTTRSQIEAGSTRVGRTRSPLEGGGAEPTAACAGGSRCWRTRRCRPPISGSEKWGGGMGQRPDVGAAPLFRRSDAAPFACLSLVSGSGRLACAALPPLAPRSQRRRSRAPLGRRLCELDRACSRHVSRGGRTTRGRPATAFSWPGTHAGERCWGARRRGGACEVRTFSETHASADSWVTSLSVNTSASGEARFWGWSAHAGTRAQALSCHSPLADRV